MKQLTAGWLCFYTGTSIYACSTYGYGPVLMPFFKGSYISDDVPAVVLAAPAIIQTDPFRAIWARNGRVSPKLAREFVDTALSETCDTYVTERREQSIAVLPSRLNFFANLYIAIARDHNPRGFLNAKAVESDIPFFARLNKELGAELEQTDHYERQANSLKKFLLNPALNDAIHAHAADHHTFADLIDHSIASPLPYRRRRQEHLIRVLCHAHADFYQWDRAEVYFQDHMVSSGTFESRRLGIINIRREGSFFDMANVGLHEEQHHHQLQIALLFRQGNLNPVYEAFATVMNANMQAYIRPRPSWLSYIQQPMENDAEHVEQVFFEWAKNMLKPSVDAKAAKPSRRPYQIPRTAIAARHAG